MKRAKKLISMLLTLIMVLTMMTGIALADDEDSYKITVVNATVSKSYTVYKIFDATASGDSVAYTIDSSANSDLYSKLTAAGTPFKFAGTGNEKVVTVKSDKTPADVISFLNGLELTGGTTKKAASNSVVFDNLTSGYYFVESEIGTVVSLTNATKDVKVVDKNQTPGWDPEDPVPTPSTDNPTPTPNVPTPGTPGTPGTPDDEGTVGKFVKAQDADGNDIWVKENSSSINDENEFMINAYAPKFIGTDKVVSYIFTDTYGDKFTNVSDIKVYVTDPASKAKTEITAKCKIANDTANGEFTVAYFVDAVTGYPSDAHISIQYSADLSGNATATNINTASMNYYTVPVDVNDPDRPFYPENPDDPTNPGNDTPTITPDPADPDATPVPTYPVTPVTPSVTPNPSTTTTNTYGLQLKKVDVDNSTLVLDAEFELSLTSGGTAEAFVETADGYRLATDEDTDTTTVLEIGNKQIFGLDLGKYYLKETKVPDGYNGLTEPYMVEIKADNVNETTHLHDASIGNAKGTKLPTTGGMGTTIFTVVGSILVFGSLVLFVSRRNRNV